jgi:hypothetical protein
MRILLFLLIFLAIIIIPIALFAKGVKTKNKNQKASSWKGKLVDKEHVEWEDEDSPYTKDLYTLRAKTDDGKDVKINVARDEFDKWEKGDNAEKKIGELLPVKT